MFKKYIFLKLHIKPIIRIEACNNFIIPINVLLFMMDGMDIKDQCDYVFMVVIIDRVYVSCLFSIFL
jgi:hypothetical protein